MTIDSLSYFGGRGVGRYQGVVVFVPATAPGDLARVKVTAKKSKFWEGELVELITPSPHRRTPPCPVAGRCGGCAWQHLAYSEQIVQKENILRNSLKKLKNFEWRSFLAAPEEFYYRNRIQLQIRDGKKGFFALRTRDLVAIEKCHIAEQALNEKMKGLPAEDLRAKKIELALNESGEVLVMPGERDPEAALFAQVNRAQNEVLKQETLAAIDVVPDWIMDLYAGSGNLTKPLHEHYPDVPLLAAELSKTAVERGRKALPRVEWLAGDVAKVLKKRTRAQGVGVVVLDPPRTGCSDDVIAELLRFQPQQIVYISCNPMTFARDAERIVAAGQYKLDHVRGLDMFPQTEHVEIISSFSSTVLA